ncbi:MAG: MBL fold metallo-hydrolase [Austwickia sp.]|nr:MBL fold metallo-hydrolase [Austwickia sp.]
MEVLLLGTGSADGWPTPYCRCPSCLAARAAGDLRTPSSVLVDGRVLLDLGPEAGRQALRAGADLADLRAVLLTHAHQDHCDPSALLYRSWVTDAPLLVVGPRPAIDACAPWLDPAGTPVVLQVVTAGDRVELPGGYDVRVLPADHDAFGECVLYDVTGPTGVRLLYATDTGPWPAPLPELVAGLPPYDLVLLEETFGERAREPGHHDLASFAAALADLRAWGLLSAATRVLAIHLSHHNPPAAQLRRSLAALGADVGTDLARYVLGCAASDPAPTGR